MVIWPSTTSHPRPWGKSVIRTRASAGGDAIGGTGLHALHLGALMENKGTVITTFEHDKSPPRNGDLAAAVSLPQHRREALGRPPLPRQAGLVRRRARGCTVLGSGKL